MPLVVTHTKVSAVADAADSSLIRPSDWNDDHTLTGTLDVSQGGTGQTTEAEALGEMIQALTADASPDTASDYVVTYDASADTGKKVLLDDLGVGGSISDGDKGNITVSGGGTVWTVDSVSTDIARRKLDANETLYVRAAPQTCTMTSASPCVVTAATHGLQANDPVIFDWPTQRQTMTVTIASPAVVTSNAHGFVAGDAVCFRTTGATPTGLPTHLINATASKRQFCPRTYYVIASGLTANAFQVSLTSGGAAINTSGSQSGTHLVERARFIEVGTCTSATTVVTCANHGLVVDQKITFCGTGTAIANVHHYGEDWDVWYVKQVLSANTFSIATTVGGAAVDVSAGFAATTYLFRFVPTLTGLQHGETYYVLASGLTANAFTFSLTLGGSAINTTGTTVGVVRVQTGNDANDGSAATRTGAFLTIQAAYDYACTLDFNNFTLTIQLADGVYWEAINNVLDASETWIGGGTLSIYGNATNQNNVRIESDTDVGDTFSLGDPNATGSISFFSLDFYNPSFTAMNSFNWGGGISIEDWTLSGFAMDDPHIYVQGQTGVGRTTLQGTIDVLWGAGLTSGGATGSVLAIGGGAFVSAATPIYRLFNDPIFQMGLVHCEFGGHYRGFGDTWTGTYTGADGKLDAEGSQIATAFFDLPGTPLITSGKDEQFIDQSGAYNRYVENIKFDSLNLYLAEPYINFTNTDTSPSAGDPAGFIGFNGYDSGANVTGYGWIQMDMETVTNGSEQGAMRFTTIAAGAGDVDQLTISSGLILGNYAGTAPGQGWVQFKSAKGFKDDSGNEFLVFTKTATAVNEFTLTNAAASSSPSIAATGGDTNINVVLTPKGSGGVVSSGYVKTLSTTFGALPSAATAGSGARAFITDSNTATFLATAAAGGANKVPVVSDGTNWLVG